MLRWEDENGKQRERTTAIPATDANYKAALKLAAELERELAGDSPPSLLLTTKQRKRIKEFEVEASDPSPLDGSWTAYRTYFFDTHITGLSKSYADTMGPILSRFEAFASPTFLSEVTPAMIRRWLASLRKENLADATIKTYWRHVSAFLSLALEDGLIKELPKVRLPKTDSRSLSKGRPINLEEFERMKLVAQSRKHAEQWTFLLDGLWLSGLRIGEAYRLTWNESEFFVDMERARPCFVIMKQKNKKREKLPLVPEFARLLGRIPPMRRNGLVFRLDKDRGNGRVSQAQTEKVIGKFGALANVKVGSNKTASAHDLRRSFASRWAVKVLPQVLQRLMRHSEITTTMKYYAEIDIDALADQIYNTPNQSTVGTTVGRTAK